MESGTPGPPAPEAPVPPATALDQTATAVPQVRAGSGPPSAPYPVITYLPQALLRPYIDRALSDRKSSLNISVQTGTSATAIMLAVHGAGIALVETALFSARPIAGFVTRPIEPKVELKILLLRPRQEAGSKVLTDFIEHLRSVFP